MGYPHPVNLIVAIVVAAIGATLLGFVGARLLGERRRRRELTAQAPDTSAYDVDIQRYLNRVWLLIADWKPRVSAPAELDELWEVALGRADALQRSRADDAESADQVAGLVELENEIESKITALSELSR